MRLVVAQRPRWQSPAAETSTSRSTRCGKRIASSAPMKPPIELPTMHGRVDAELVEQLVDGSRRSRVIVIVLARHRRRAEARAGRAATHAVAGCGEDGQVLQPVLPASPTARGSKTTGVAVGRPDLDDVDRPARHRRPSAGARASRCRARPSGPPGRSGPGPWRATVGSGGHGALRYAASPMQIAIDIDSTLHHYWDVLSRRGPRRFGIDLPYEEQYEWGITRLKPEQLAGRASRTPTARRRSSPGGPYPGAVETVNRWDDAGHFIHITSHRAEGCHDATARWLDDDRPALRRAVLLLRQGHPLRGDRHRPPHRRQPGQHRRAPSSSASPPRRSRTRGTRTSSRRRTSSPPPTGRRSPPSSRRRWRPCAAAAAPGQAA